MIQSFRGAEAERTFHQHPSKQFRPIEKIALRKLIHLNQAKSLRDLAAIPGNRLGHDVEIVVKPKKRGAAELRVA